MSFYQIALVVLMIACIHSCNKIIQFTRGGGMKTILKYPGAKNRLISGYDTPLYSEMLKDWKKEMHKNQVECGLQKNECIWMNY